MQYDAFLAIECTTESSGRSLAPGLQLDCGMHALLFLLLCTADSRRSVFGCAGSARECVGP